MPTTARAYLVLNSFWYLPCITILLQNFINRMVASLACCLCPCYLEQLLPPSTLMAAHHVLNTSITEHWCGSEGVVSEQWSAPTALRKPAETFTQAHERQDLSQVYAAANQCEPQLHPYLGNMC